MLVKQHALQIFNSKVDSIAKNKSSRDIFHGLYFQARFNSQCDNQI